MRAALAILAGLALSACDKSNTPEFQPVNVVADTFCMQDKKEWSVYDTDKTINTNRAFNAEWDERCSKKGAAKK